MKPIAPEKDQRMQVFKTAVGVSNVLLLLAGAVVWAVGAAAKNPSRKAVGSVFLSAWAVHDVVSMILAFSLGWFA